ncbi:MAG: hypothetical protein ACYTG2_15265 [Planctomycetota bacterium]
MKQTVLGLALLATSAAVGRDVLPAPGTHQEPLARALEPLGPVKALISSALWMGVQAGQRSGDASRVVDLSHALLDLQPDLDEVRRFLAGQLVVTEAPRAADRVRHDALVRAGLTLLEEGLERRDSSALRVELAETIVVQRFMDPAFEPVAAQHFGAPPLDVAIELYAGAERTEGRTRLLAALYVERGERALVRADDRWAARRDLEAAEALLEPLRASSEGTDLDAILEPLRTALGGSAAGKDDDAR